jgi:hypothetical protein
VYDCLTLLKALDITSHILFIGDPDQLPSVGAGNVLKNSSTSKFAPVVALVGTLKAISIAVRNDKVAQRNSRLAKRLATP